MHPGWHTWRFQVLAPFLKCGIDITTDKLSAFVKLGEAAASINNPVLISNGDGCTPHPEKLRVSLLPCVAWGAARLPATSKAVLQEQLPLSRRKSCS